MERAQTSVARGKSTHDKDSKMMNIQNYILENAFPGYDGEFQLTTPPKEPSKDSTSSASKSTRESVMQQNGAIVTIEIDSQSPLE